jgi:hypothetical protein
MFATILLLAPLLVTTNADSQFGFLALPFKQLFWQAPAAVMYGFGVTTFLGSVYLQKKLECRNTSLKTIILWLLVFSLLYSLAINLARDFGFCFERWVGLIEVGKSYCRAETYLTLDNWVMAILIAAIYYAAILSLTLVIVNYAIFQAICRLHERRQNLENN